MLVFVTKRDKGSIRVKLGDFGIAKFETDGTDTYVGSREFLAPVRLICIHVASVLIRTRSNGLQIETAERRLSEATYMPWEVSGPIPAVETDVDLFSSHHETSHRPWHGLSRRSYTKATAHRCLGRFTKPAGPIDLRRCARTSGKCRHHR